MPTAKHNLNPKLHAQTNAIHIISAHELSPNIKSSLRILLPPPRPKRQSPKIPLSHLPHILRLLVRQVAVSVTFALEARCEGVQAVADEDGDDAADYYEEDDYFIGEVGHCCGCRSRWAG